MYEYKERLLGTSAWRCMDVISLICMRSPISVHFSSQAESHNPSHQSSPLRSQLILKEFFVLHFYNLGRAISGGEKKFQHLTVLQTHKKCSVSVWECPKGTIWLNAFLWRSIISAKASEQNCSSQVSVLPINWSRFISVTVSLGLVVNKCYLCVVGMLKVFQASLKWWCVP